MWQLQSCLSHIGIIIPGREFVKEGELNKVCRKGLQPRYFILFNDSLLYLSYSGPSGGLGLKLNAELPLSGMKVKIPTSEDYQNEFSIITVTRSFTLSASTVVERQEWVDALQSTIDDFKSRRLTFSPDRDEHDNIASRPSLPLGQQAPVWIPDSRVTMCQSCGAEFRMTFRRHHCRACGKVVCHFCSANRAPLEYLNNQSERVCDICFEFLQKDFEDKFQRKSVRDSFNENIDILRQQFQKLTTRSNAYGRITNIPQRLREVSANDEGSEISGYLHVRHKRVWKKFWYVIKNKVLYWYKASADVIAIGCMPLIGYTVVSPIEACDLPDPEVTFQLNHQNKFYAAFYAESSKIAQRWVSVMRDATILEN